MSHRELLSYTFGLQDDPRSVRELLSVALDAVAQLTAEHDRLRVRIQQLLSELRECLGQAA